MGGEDKLLTLAFAGIASAGERLQPDWREHQALAEECIEYVYATADSEGLIDAEADWMEAGKAVRERFPRDTRDAIREATKSIHAAPGEAEEAEALSHLAYVQLRLGEPDIALDALRIVEQSDTVTAEGLAYQKRVYEVLGLRGDAKRVEVKYRWPLKRVAPYVLLAGLLLLGGAIWRRRRKGARG